MIYSYYNKNPKPLEEPELIELFQKYQAGDNDSYEQLILHNLNLIKFIINEKFSHYQVDREELFSIGEIGLMKAIQTYDFDKNAKFSSYAVKCITNEILKFIRKNKRNLTNVSLSDTYFMNKDGVGLTYEELLADSTVNIEQDFFQKERLKYIKQIVDEMSDSRDKEIIKLVFGFEKEPMHQYEVAEKFNLSQPSISKIIKKSLIYIAKKLKEMEEQDLQIDSLQKSKEKTGPTISEILDCSKKEFLNLYQKLTLDDQEKLSFLLKIDFNRCFEDLNTDLEKKDVFNKLVNRIKELRKGERKKVEFQKNLDNINKTDLQKKKTRRRIIKPIYLLLEPYTKEEIDAVIATLNEKDKKLIWLRYGDDLEHPVENPELTDKQKRIFYNGLIPKLKRKLKMARIVKERVEAKNKENLKFNLETMITPQDEKEKTNPIILELTKQFLRNFQISDYQNFLSILSIKEIIISLLVMQTAGNYTIKEIADFMRITEKEVISITKKMLVLYRESINFYFDNLMKNLDDTSEKTLIKNPNEAE